MTKQKPLPEILPGPHGKAEMMTIQPMKTKAFYVRSEDDVAGWTGPMRKTARGAINAWNRVMRVYHAAKKGAK